MLFDVNKPQHCFAQRLKLQNDSLAQQILVRSEESLPIPAAALSVHLCPVCVCGQCNFMSKRMKIEEIEDLFLADLLIMDLARKLNTLLWVNLIQNCQEMPRI